MKMSKREEKFFQTLLENQGFLTASFIANQLSVSSKTVYRVIKKINDCSEYGEVIYSEPGKGFKINERVYHAVARQNLKQNDVDRKDEILLKLLFKSSVKMHLDDLYKDYYLSDSSIKKEIGKLNDYLSEYDLMIKKHGKRIYIEGGEDNIRKCLNQLISKMYSFDESVDDDNQLDFNKYDLQLIQEQIHFIEKKLKQAIIYPYNMNIFSHLFVLMQRYKEGKVIQQKEDSRLDIEELSLISNYQEVYEVSKQVIDKLSRYIHVALPSMEIYYLFQYILSSRFENALYSVAINENTQEITNFYIDYVLDRLEGDEHIDRNGLYHDLIHHISPMLIRLAKSIPVKNSLLEEVRNEYSVLYDLIRQASLLIDENYCYSLAVSEEESGYLTLYFARYLEGNDKEKRILILCSSGVGTSELLKVKVKKRFPDVDIVDVVSYRVFTNRIHQYQDIDLILSTLNTKQLNCNHNVLIVSPVFNENDAKKLASILKEV